MEKRYPQLHSPETIPGPYVDLNGENSERSKVYPEQYELSEIHKQGISAPTKTQNSEVLIHTVKGKFEGTFPCATPGLPREMRSTPPQA